jgi:hypothetical protein
MSGDLFGIVLNVFFHRTGSFPAIAKAIEGEEDQYGEKESGSRLHSE